MYLLLTGNTIGLRLAVCVRQCLVLAEMVIAAQIKQTYPKPSWETRETLGISRALYHTAREMLLDTRRTFESMPIDEGSYNAPIYTYILSIGSITVFIAGLCSAIVTGFHISGDQLMKFFLTDTTIFPPIAFLPALPVVIALACSLQVWRIARSNHKKLEQLGLAEADYAATVRVAWYAIGTGLLFWTIPSLVWFVFLGLHTLVEHAALALLGHLPTILLSSRTLLAVGFFIFITANALFIFAGYDWSQRAMITGLSAVHRKNRDAVTDALYRHMGY